MRNPSVCPPTSPNSRASLVQAADGGDQRRVRDTVDRLGDAARAGHVHRVAVGGLLAQAGRPGADTAQHVHGAVSRDEGRRGAPAPASIAIEANDNTNWFACCGF